MHTDTVNRESIRKGIFFRMRASPFLYTQFQKSILRRVQASLFFVLYILVRKYFVRRDESYRKKKKTA